MIKIKNLIGEILPFDKIPVVKSGLSKKYGTDELDAYTFGIELEYEPSSTNEINFDKLRMELDNNEKVHRDYDDWLENQRNDYNRRLRSTDDWDETYGPMSVDVFDSLVDEPSRSDYDDEEHYKTDHKKWEEWRDDIGHKYNYWENHDKHDYMDEYIDQLINGGDWERYVNPSDVANRSSIEDDILDAISYIQNEMGEKAHYNNSKKDIWGVGPDGSNIEIQSKHLNQSEFDLVKQICDYVSRQNVSGDTSAHVHIGLPDDFDAFDLLAITTLVDERAIVNQVGPDRNLSTWAKLRDALHNTIVNQLIKTPENQSTNEKSFVLNNDRLFLLLGGVGRYWGTNVNSMKSKRTIEFRYLDSKITKNPLTFIKWIQYYLLLPKVAKSRNSIILKQNIGSDSQSVTAIRQSGSVKFVLNVGKYSTPNYPSADLKKGTVGVVSPKIAQAKKEKMAKINI